MSRHPIPAITLCAALAPLSALAQGVDLATITLDPIIIAGGLTPLSAESYARSHTVLEAEDLAASGAASVQDALRQVPGVAVTATGDSLTSLRIRGSESSHVLVLIDGVEANSPGDGNYIFSGMDLADIARIEVLRGPQSTIHGPNAAAGVVAITTRRADRPGLSWGGAVEAGSLGTRAAGTWLQHRSPRGELGFSLSLRKIDGEDASHSGGDRDFNDITTAGLHGRHDLAEGVSLGFVLRRSWQEYGYDEGSMTPVADPDDYLIDAPLTADRNERYGAVWIEAEALGGRWLNRLSWSGMNTDTAHFDAGHPYNNDRSTRRKLRYTGTLALDGAAATEAAQKLTFAAEAGRETYRSTYNPGGRYTRKTRGLAVEYQGIFDNGISVQAGLRRDFNDHFRDATSWNLAAAWQVPDRDLRLRAAAGRASVNPDMFQQYGYTPGMFAGNPDLRPETVRNVELGADLDLAQGHAQASVTLFHGRIEDMIVGTGDSAANVEGTSTRKGFELGFGIQPVEGLRLAADYTYVDATRSDGAPISRTPRHQLGLRASADVAGGRGQVSAGIRHVAGNHDTEWFNWSGTVSRLPDYTTVDLAGHYVLNDELRLEARINNLFDRSYSEAWGYRAPGRTAYVGLSARW